MSERQFYKGKCSMKLGYFLRKSPSFFTKCNNTAYAHSESAFAFQFTLLVIAMHAFEVIDFVNFDVPSCGS
jgi:hypothetical protein